MTDKEDIETTALWWDARREVGGDPVRLAQEVLRLRAWIRHYRMYFGFAEWFVGADHKWSEAIDAAFEKALRGEAAPEHGRTRTPEVPPRG